MKDQEQEKEQERGGKPDETPFGGPSAAPKSTTARTDPAYPTTPAPRPGEAAEGEAVEGEATEGESGAGQPWFEQPAATASAWALQVR